MRFTDLLLLGAASAAFGSPIEQRQTANAGYLAAVFYGTLEQVYFELAPASTPQTFKTLNGGQPYLKATTGTGGARDPAILQADDGTMYVLATDLQIGKTTWDESQRTGSLSIHVWQSTDGVTWSADRLVKLMDSTAGFVWAPSAIPDPAANAYAVFWSSNTFAASDPSHRGAATGPYIFYSHTSDFRTFTKPQQWTTGSETFIDQEIQHLSGNSYIRYLKDSAINKVYVERSDNGLFGSWKRLGLVTDAVREGPASFQDIENPNRYYVWVDNYSGQGGYECHYTDDFKTPFPICPTALTPKGMRHGGVVQLDKARYDALSKK